VDGPTIGELGAAPFPVMLLAGEKDAVLSPGTVRRAGELLPSAASRSSRRPPLYVLGNADLFNDALRKFLAEVYAG